MVNTYNPPREIGFETSLASNSKVPMEGKKERRKRGREGEEEGKKNMRKGKKGEREGKEKERKG